MEADLAFTFAVGRRGEDRWGREGRGGTQAE